jgi:hypothetical protein
MVEDTRAKWLVAEAQRLRDQQDHYADQAFYTALAAFCAQQQHELELAVGEVDGRSWNHEKW